MQKNKFTITVFPVTALALLSALCMLFSGCYTLKQGSALLGYLNRAVPLEELLDPPAKSKIKSNDANRSFAQRVYDIRSFAMEELGLKMSKNYTRYVQIEQDYLAAVVSACAPDSFNRHLWHFPIVGAVPYKGFFDDKDALKEREKLKKKGLDVWIRGVEAFSTLGWFKDPLYSYMQEYPIERLAELLIHELLHATVFVKGHVQFNEELAEFVGSEGAKLYIESRFGRDSAEYQKILLRELDELAFVSFIHELIDELETLYASDAEREEKLIEKERIIKSAKERFAGEYYSRFSNNNYLGFTELPVNNAYFDLYRLYYEKDSFFADLYAETLGEGIPKLHAFIDKAASLNNSREGRKNPRKALNTMYTT